MFLKPVINYVAVDVGNVLVHVNFQVFINDVSKQFNITLEEAEYFIKRTPSLHDMGLTRMSDELRNYFKIKSPLIMKDLLESWDKVITPNTSMINFFNKMRVENNLQIALLSNVGLEHAKQMFDMLSSGDFFSHAIKHFSCFVGARKPTMLYYQSFLMQHPEFEGCAYLDDLHENLVASKQFSFRPLHFSLEQCGANTRVKQEKLNEIKDFILNGSKVEKNSRWH